jgi:glycosyltransferase involved in cell wall biosynthesis
MLKHKKMTDAVWLYDPCNLVPNYTYALARGLVRRGCSVYLVSSPYDYCSDLLLDKSVGWIDWPSPISRGLLGRLNLNRGLPRQLTRLMEYPFGVIKLAARMMVARPSVLHIQWDRLPWLDLILVLWARMLGVRIVFTVHDVEPLYARTPMRSARALLFAMSHQILVHSRENKQSLCDMYGSKLHQRVFTIPMGVDSDASMESDGVAIRRRLGIPANHFVCGFIGNLKAYKGVDLLMPALQQMLADRDAPISLLVAGRCEDAGLAEPLLRAAREDARIHFDNRYLDESEIDSYFSAADVILLPYRKISQSGIVFRAMANARPVIAANVGGLPESVRPEHGWLFSAGDAAALAERIARAYAEHATLSNRGRAAQAYVQRYHDWAHIAQQHKLHYFDRSIQPSEERVVVIAPNFPWPARRGEQVVLMGRLEEWRRAGVAVELMCMNPHPVAAADLQHVSKLCARVEVVVVPRWRSLGYAAITAWLPWIPMQVGYYFSLRFWWLVRRRVSNEGALHVMLLRLAHYADHRAPTAILELIDSMWLNARVRSSIARGIWSALWREEARRLRSYEQRAVRRFGSSIVVAQRDRQVFPPWLRMRVAVLPNGVRVGDVTAATAQADERPFIVFFGNLSYGPNVDGICSFVGSIWPEMKRVLPHLELKIIGAHPTEGVRQLGEHAGVEVLPNVPNIEAAIAGALCSIVPLNAASGVQNKLLESLAAGVPVVATAEATDGLITPLRRVVHTVSTASCKAVSEQWIEAVRTLLYDSVARQHLAESGRRLVLRECSWQHAAQWLRSRHRTLSSPILTPGLPRFNHVAPSRHPALAKSSLPLGST